jgi:hypothetical protein
MTFLGLVQLSPPVAVTSLQLAPRSLILPSRMVRPSIVTPVSAVFSLMVSTLAEPVSRIAAAEMLDDDMSGAKTADADRVDTVTVAAKTADADRVDTVMAVVAMALAERTLTFWLRGMAGFVTVSADTATADRDASSWPESHEHVTVATVDQLDERMVP